MSFGNTLHLSKKEPKNLILIFANILKIAKAIKLKKEIENK